MGYELDALLVPAAQAKAVTKGLEAAKLFPLGSGLVLVAMTEELFKELHRESLRTNPAPIAGWEHLTEMLEEWAAQQSQGGPVAYVEAGYFGGMGSQYGVLWESGKRVYGPAREDDAINQCLRRLGVVAAPGQDEFDTVELGRFRRTNRWAEKAQTVLPRLLSWLGISIRVRIRRFLKS